MDKFVLQVPKWKGELVFSEELLVFLGMILMLVVGVLFCFWGYKYFRTILLLGIGTVVGYFSFLLVAPMTTNLAVRMFLTVSLTFFGVCFVYFFDIIFCYVLDKLRIRNALGKRSYLLAAPLGAVIFGLTIYHFIWRDEITVGVFSAVCLVIGLIFQHHKRKKMIRFRSYNDLLRLKRPKLDEDGLEIISVGMAGAAALAPVSSVLVTPEPEPEAVPVMEAEPEPEAVPVMEAEPEPEAVPVMEAEPEPEAVPVMEAEPAPEPEPVFKPRLVLEPKFEPEPIFVTNAKLQALSEIESEFAAGTEYGHGLQSIPEEIVEETVTPVAELEQIVKRIMASAAEPAPEPVSEMSVETKSEPEPVSEMSVEKEPEAESVPVEISDDIKNLILRKMESEEELLEEAFFVRQISKKMAGEKQLNVQRRAEIPGNAAVEKREGKDTRVKKADSVYSGKITITGKDRKSRRKREEGVAKGAVLAAAGLGAFIAGRISKGGD